MAHRAEPLNTTAVQYRLLRRVLPGLRTVRAVDSDDALAQLPRAYSLAIRLHRLGADVDLIAECLELAPESVGPLLDVAAAKLARVREIDLREVVGDIEQRRATT